MKYSDKVFILKNKKKFWGLEKRKWSLSIAIFVVIVFLGVTLKGYSKTEFDKRPIIQDKMSVANADYLYDFYVKRTPNIENRLAFGDEHASIIFIAYIDLTAETSVRFFKEFFPALKTDYIESGMVKFYHKNYLLKEDYDQKTPRFVMSKSLLCIKEISPEEYYPYYFDIVGQTPEIIPDLIKKHNIDQAAYSACMDSGSSKELLEDLSEVDNFGMIGLNPRIYIGLAGSKNSQFNGIPNYNRVKRIIKSDEVQIGIA